MRAVAVWTLGTAYVLAALASVVAVVWAADHEDNSVDPTHWAVGALVVLAPVGFYGAWLQGGAWIRERLAGSQLRFAVGLAVVVAVAAALVVGAQAVIADASACGDDDCARLVVPVAIACMLGAWSFAVGALDVAARPLPGSADERSAGCCIADVGGGLGGGGAADRARGRLRRFSDRRHSAGLDPARGRGGGSDGGSARPDGKCGAAHRCGLDGSRMPGRRRYLVDRVAVCGGS